MRIGDAAREEPDAGRQAADRAAGDPAEAERDAHAYRGAACVRDAWRVGNGSADIWRGPYHLADEILERRDPARYRSQYGYSRCGRLRHGCVRRQTGA